MKVMIGLSNEITVLEMRKKSLRFKKNNSEVTRLVRPSLRAVEFFLPGVR